MKTTLTLDSFIAQSAIPSALISAVAKQCGGWEEFTGHAEDVVNHGADSGFSGFTYYSETVAFALANLPAIREYLKIQAEEWSDMSALEFVKGFRCLNNDFTLDEIGEALFGADPDATAILNALAWYALEEVSRAYVDATE